MRRIWSHSHIKDKGWKNHGRPWSHVAILILKEPSPEAGEWAPAVGETKLCGSSLPQVLRPRLLTYPCCMQPGFYWRFFMCPRSSIPSLLNSKNLFSSSSSSEVVEAEQVSSSLPRNLKFLTLNLPCPVIKVSSARSKEIWGHSGFLGIVLHYLTVSLYHNDWQFLCL